MWVDPITFSKSKIHFKDIFMHRLDVLFLYLHDCINFKRINSWKSKTKWIFIKKNCCLHFLSRILTSINIHLFKVNNFVISEPTKHVSKCKKCEKRFAKKVAELEILLVCWIFIFTEAVVWRCSVEKMF